MSPRETCNLRLRHLRHWFPFLQRTTILTFTLWPLGKAWRGQHSQFLRCLLLLLSFLTLRSPPGWKPSLAWKPSWRTKLNLTGLVQNQLGSAHFITSSQMSGWPAHTRPVYIKSVKTWNNLNGREVYNVYRRVTGKRLSLPLNIKSVSF